MQGWGTKTQYFVFEISRGDNGGWTIEENAASTMDEFLDFFGNKQSAWLHVA
jgi:hypothetical protein